MYDEDVEEASYCPVCIEPHYPMAIWGTVAHYTCRFCGGWWKESVNQAMEDE